MLHAPSLIYTSIYIYFIIIIALDNFLFGEVKKKIGELLLLYKYQKRSILYQCVVDYNIFSGKK